MANFFVGFPANATSIGSPFQRPSLTFSGMRAVMGDASAASPSVQDILNLLKLHTVHIRFGSRLLVATCICAPTVSTTTATVAQQVQKESTPKLCLAAQCAWPKDIWKSKRGGANTPGLPVTYWASNLQKDCSWFHTGTSWGILCAMTLSLAMVWLDAFGHKDHQTPSRLKVLSVCTCPEQFTSKYHSRIKDK